MTTVEPPNKGQMVHGPLSTIRRLSFMVCFLSKRLLILDCIGNIDIFNNYVVIVYIPMIMISL